MSEVLLRRHGVGDMYEARLPNGAHLTVWPDFSAEIVMETGWGNGARTQEVVAFVPKGSSLEGALARIAPYVHFRRSGTIGGPLVIGAYKRYTPGELKQWPHLAWDLQEHEEERR